MNNEMQSWPHFESIIILKLLTPHLLFSFHLHHRFPAERGAMLRQAGGVRFAGEEDDKLVFVQGEFRVFFHAGHGTEIAFQFAQFP